MKQVNYHATFKWENTGPWSWFLQQAASVIFKRQYPSKTVLLTNIEWVKYSSKQSLGCVYFYITPSGSPNIFWDWNHFKTVSHSTSCWRLPIARKVFLNGKDLNACNPEIFSWRISTLRWTKFQVCPSELYHNTVSDGKQTRWGG